ncbi:unnamed protein product [Cunninghamella echinulata]
MVPDASLAALATAPEKKPDQENNNTTTTEGRLLQNPDEFVNSFRPTKKIYQKKKFWGVGIVVATITAVYMVFSQQ